MRVAGDPMTATLTTATRCPDCGQVHRVHNGAIVTHDVRVSVAGGVAQVRRCTPSAESRARDDARVAVVERVREGR